MWDKAFRKRHSIIVVSLSLVVELILVHRLITTFEFNQDGLIELIFFSLFMSLCFSIQNKLIQALQLYSTHDETNSKRRHLKKDKEKRSNISLGSKQNSEQSIGKSSDKAFNGLINIKR